MIIAGTGHRPNKLSGYGSEASKKLFHLARHALNELQPDGVISGLALGWDTALADAALDLRIPLTAAIPFEGQQSRWPADSQTNWQWLVDSAAYTIIVSEGG